MVGFFVFLICISSGSLICKLHIYIRYIGLYIDRGNVCEYYNWNTEKRKKPIKKIQFGQRILYFLMSPFALLLYSRTHVYKYTSLLFNLTLTIPKSESLYVI